MPSYYPLFNPDSLTQMFSRPSTPIPYVEMDTSPRQPKLVRQDAYWNIWEALWDEVNDEIIVHSIVVDKFNSNVMLSTDDPDMLVKFNGRTIQSLSPAFDRMKSRCKNPLPHLLRRIENVFPLEDIPAKPLVGVEKNPGPPPPSPYLVQAICDVIVKVVDELVDAVAPPSFFPPDAVVPSDEVFLAQWLCSS